MPLGEVISLFMGQCGTQISQALWELISVEHGIGPDGMLVDPLVQTEDDTAASNVLFTHTQKDRFVPRAAIVDSEPTVVDEIRTGLYRGMFNPARLVTGLEDMANNFGRGYYGCPQNLVDQGMNAVRKEAEQADKLQSCLVFHSFGGGTGAGTTCRLVELMDAEFMKVPKIEMAIYPDYHKSCSVVEPYNAVLCSSTLDEVSSFALLIENDALCRICNESLRMERPSYPNLNRVLAHACSGILAPLCFDGPLTASLPQLQTNLVPYPRLHFLQASLNPMFTHDQTIHEAITIQELTNGAFNTINQMMVGDPKETVMMATALLYRGQIPIQEINSSIDAIKKRGLIGLVDWCPTGFKIGVVPTLPAVIQASGIGKTNRQLTALYNSTLIVSPLKANLHKFKVLLSKKAFIHWYLQEGMEQGEFQECMEDVLNILQDYLFVEKTLTHNRTGGADNVHGPPPRPDRQSRHSAGTQNSHSDAGASSGSGSAVFAGGGSFGGLSVGGPGGGGSVGGPGGGGSVVSAAAPSSNFRMSPLPGAPASLTKQSVQSAQTNSSEESEDDEDDEDDDEDDDDDDDEDDDEDDDDEDDYDDTEES